MLPTEAKNKAEMIRVSNDPAPDERVAGELAREAKACDRGAVGSFIKRVMSVAPPDTPPRPAMKQAPRIMEAEGDNGRENFVPRSGSERAFYRDLALMLADVALHVERETKAPGPGGRESLLLHFAAAALAAYIGTVGAKGTENAGAGMEGPDIDALMPALRDAAGGGPVPR